MAAFMTLLESRCISKDLRRFRRENLVLCYDIQEVGNRIATIKGSESSC